MRCRGVPPRRSRRPPLDNVNALLSFAYSLLASECRDYGQRVQNSVFECVLDAAQYRMVKHRLEGLIDPEKDSLRFYNLGNNYQSRVEHVGAKPTYAPEGLLML